MSRLRTAGLAPLAILGSLAPAGLHAAPWVFSGSATLRGGVDSNPFLQVNVPGVAPQIGGGVVANLAKKDAKSTTTISGSADISGYTRYYGNNSNFLASLARQQSFSEHLSAYGQVTYINTRNPQPNFGFDPSVQTNQIDYLTVGQRSQQVNGLFNLDWQPTSRDTFRIGGNASHASYSTALASSYDSYGGNLGYLRTLDARTRIGFSTTASSIHSSGYPSAQSYGANVQIVRKLGEGWLFDGSFGIVKPHSSYPLARNGLTFGFSGSLCGNYPRYQLCFIFSRGAAPSGIGGLRIDTTLSLSGSYQLTERSTLTFFGTANLSSSRDQLSLLPKQRYYQASTTYTRKISPRIGIGVTGRYQRRSTTGSVLFVGSTPSSYAATGNISYAFGRSQ